MWGTILITLVAAAGNNIGKALQKSATRSLPQINLAKPEVGSSQEWRRHAPLQRMRHAAPVPAEPM
jgi:hypothetical protein